MRDSKQEQLNNRAAYWALLLGIGGLLLGYGLIYAFPQQPDGDITALTQFETQYGRHPRHHIHNAFWLNLSGALFAWGALGYFLRQLMILIELPIERQLLFSFSLRAIRQWALLLMWGGVLVMWSGWAWNQTRGWQGTLFLEAGLATPLGEDGRPIVTFDRFLIPPAADGAGRALSLQLLVNQTRHQISEAAPYRGGGWTLKPHWYGVTVKSERLPQPLFFGKPGTIQALLKEDSPVAVTVNTTPLSAKSIPPLPDLHVAYHAIIEARFAPGLPLQQIGALIVLIGAVGGAILDFRF